MPTTHTPESDKAEADKLVATSAATNGMHGAAAFLDFLRARYVLAEYGEHDRLWPAHVNPETLLAEFCEIDLAAVERHRRRLLDAIRKGEG